MNIKIQYICDGKASCCESKNCYKNGGFCDHISDEAHALNISKQDVPFVLIHNCGLDYDVDCFWEIGPDDQHLLKMKGENTND